jgi:hypothetical protein
MALPFNSAAATPATGKALSSSRPHVGQATGNLSHGSVMGCDLHIDSHTDRRAALQVFNPEKMALHKKL